MFAGMRCRGFEKDNNLYLKTLSDGLLILFRARDTHSLVLKEFKVSPRVKKGEFSKFLISGRLDEVFQELSFKKNPQNNIISAQSYWTLKFTAR